MFERSKQFIARIKSALAATATEDYIRAIGFFATLGVTLFLFATGKPIPDGLQVLLSAFMGFYVGRTSANSTQTPNTVIVKQGGVG